jgi:hypothetical protein
MPIAPSPVCFSGKRGPSLTVMGKLFRAFWELSLPGKIAQGITIARCNGYPLCCVRNGSRSVSRISSSLCPGLRFMVSTFPLCVSVSLSVSPSVRLSDILLLITLSDVSFPATSEGSFVLSLIHKHERRANFSLACMHALPSGVQFSLARALRLAPLLTLARTHSNHHPSSHSRPHTKMTTSLTSDCERHP